MTWSWLLAIWCEIYLCCLSYCYGIVSPVFFFHWWTYLFGVAIRWSRLGRKVHLLSCSKFNRGSQSRLYKCIRFCNVIHSACQLLGERNKFWFVWLFSRTQKSLRFFDVSSTMAFVDGTNGFQSYYFFFGHIYPGHGTNSRIKDRRLDSQKFSAFIFVRKSDILV